MKPAAVMLWLGVALQSAEVSRAAEAAPPLSAPPPAKPASAAPSAANPPTAAPRPVAGPAVELPPMMVEESVSTVPWLYVNVGGAEFLSRCSASTTRQFVEAWLTKMQLVRVLVPEEFLMKSDIPTVIVLYAQDLQQTVSAEIQRELQGSQPRIGDSDRDNRVNIAPNMRLSDRDMHASIVYLDEALFDASTLSIAPGHVRFLLAGRLPDLPTWLVDGVERLWRTADFVLEPITLRPFVWQNQGESDALAGDRGHPRALLPANELFATDTVRASENHHARHAEARACTQELFVRWAITSGAATRDALWKFAAATAGNPATEELFEAFFGFDYAELRDRLSDYLPKAVVETKRIRPGEMPPLPSFETELATPNQIARVRGEWERLAIGHVQRRLPKAREPYIAQARRTLHRVYDQGDRDPRLLATLGLVEIEAGNEAGARPFLEPAVATGVVRPRAYYELARLRFAELRRAAPESKIFSFTELAPVIDPLRRATAQAPALPEVFTLLAEAWERCETPPNTGEFKELELGARLFANRAPLMLPIARALARHGKKEAAATLLATTAGHAIDNGTRAEIARLRSEFGAPSDSP